ncbi:helix-turn-helix transcriptional regulator [Hungatella sp. L12]|uniref:Helix-turn-helix transcriptional regulator n=1 Tax=Hungatella hominis TaxID=2763050 RepID=A0ABR7HFK3_9FIRM|nr:helix-turn-helix transcriptional regulator [Hungatella hominis]MBC5711950.1 helix-turn-helix transcriptional regulator [Hungatella hominis]
MSDTGEIIKKLRIENGMTLEELGDKIGVGKSTVRKWENGIIANMKRDKIAKIASIFNVSPSYLMGWEEQEDIETMATSLDLLYNDKSFQLVANKYSLLKNEISIRRLLKYMDLLIEEENEL